MVKSTRKLGFAIVALMAALVLAVGTTFAWLTIDNKASVNVTVEVNSETDGLVVSFTDGSNYYNTLTRSGAYAQLLKQVSYYSASETSSSTDGVSTEGFYVLDDEAELPNTTYTSGAGRYISIPLYFRSISGEIQDIYLINTSSVTPTNSVIPATQRYNTFGTVSLINYAYNSAAVTALTKSALDTNGDTINVVTSRAAYAARIGFGTVGSNLAIWNPYASEDLTWNSEKNPSFYKDNAAHDISATFFGVSDKWSDYSTKTLGSLTQYNTNTKILTLVNTINEDATIARAISVSASNKAVIANTYSYDMWSDYSSKTLGSITAFDTNEKVATLNGAFNGTSTIAEAAALGTNNLNAILAEYGYNGWSATDLANNLTALGISSDLGLTGVLFADYGTTTLQDAIDADASNEALIAAAYSYKVWTDADTKAIGSIVGLDLNTLTDGELLTTSNSIEDAVDASASNEATIEAEYGYNYWTDANTTTLGTIGINLSTLQGAVVTTASTIEDAVDASGLNEATIEAIYPYNASTTDLYTTDSAAAFTLANVATDDTITAGTSLGKTVKNDITGFYELQINVIVWIEGRDGDCFNGILSDSFNINLKFVASPSGK